MAEGGRVRGSEAELRAAGSDDIPLVLVFWGESAAPTSTDSADALAGLLHRDPESLIVAEANGRIVGSVIAGWDGWRGSIYRLAVAPDHRRQGVGAALLQAAEARLSARGARRSHAIVTGTDARAVAFWRATDWEHRSEQLRFTKG
jgi:ribosomal protein S18 acetylase RimI-like enzyme